MTLNPFELQGPAYLGFYLIACTLTGIVGYFLRLHILGKHYASIYQTTNESESIARELDPYEAAYLQGGADRVLLTACANLARHGIVQIDTGSSKLYDTLGSSPAADKIKASLHKVEEEIFSLCRVKGLAVEQAKSALRPYITNIESSLREKGLLATEDELLRARIVPFLLMFSVAALLALPKFMVGMELHKPILLLLALSAGMCFASTLFLKMNRVTNGKGELVAATMKETGCALKLTFTSRPSSLSITDTAFAYALFGTVLMASDPYSLASKLFVKPANGCGSGCGSGGSGCGSGCGGGGCGGGCGGCGG
ncbi:MAG: TIGR04222 domain-containing membrane protein [Candidatus Obscuribacter phosphatis]|uniref:TIGR04222 domain-containing membrane protein n=1 Tax=Candidatus Obscuribacter phosphatis TaxID=1906157 RepID=A0A8J7PCG0_9BACT|nr:TIGR04222 domain-containing membrane protein [Candidatus Obscuribacter phosphatis]